MSVRRQRIWIQYTL